MHLFAENRCTATDAFRALTNAWTYLRLSGDAIAGRYCMFVSDAVVVKWKRPLATGVNTSLTIVSSSSSLLLFVMMF